MNYKFHVDFNEVSIETLENKVLEWAEERGLFTNPNPSKQALKTVSEVGEMADNISKDWDCKDDIGDILVTLIIQCHIQGYNMRDALSCAYDEIKDRTGRTENGIFIKD